MKWFLLALLGTTGAAIVAACIVTLLVRHRLRRANRVDPAIDAGVPITWLGDPRVPARLHRRLVKAARLADRAAEPHRPVTRRAKKAQKTSPPAIVALATELQAHAVALDRQLVAVAATPPRARIPALRELAPAVAEVERSALRLSELSADLLRPRLLPEQEAGLADLTRRIDQLGGAHDELREIEAGTGLGVADVLGRTRPVGEPVTLPASPDPVRRPR